jgi:hypothetical protein
MPHGMSADVDRWQRPQPRYLLFRHRLAWDSRQVTALRQSPFPNLAEDRIHSLRVAGPQVMTDTSNYPRCAISVILQVELSDHAGSVVYDERYRRCPSGRKQRGHLFPPELSANKTCRYENGCLGPNFLQDRHGVIEEIAVAVVKRQGRAPVNRFSGLRPANDLTEPHDLSVTAEHVQLFSECGHAHGETEGVPGYVCHPVVSQHHSTRE